MELYTDRSKVYSGSMKTPKEAKIFLLGVPYDSGAVWTPGQRFGPQAIRQALENLEPEFGGKKLPAVYDIGDLAVGPEFAALDKRLGDTVSRIPGKFILLGGDHSISLPAIKALKPKCVVCFDAHCDSRDEWLGSRFNAGTVMKRASEIAPTVIVGARQVVGGKIIPLEKFKPKEFEGCYLSIDIDVLDPSVAPGTGTPVPQGLSLERLMELTRDLKPVAIDLVEVNPLVERMVTPTVAAWLLMHLMQILTRV